MIENPENSLSTVTGTASATSVFVYDGDSNRVKSTINTTTTAFIGNHTEWNVSTQEMTRYYLAGGQRVAFRVIKSGQADKVFYLLADHLGSTNVVMQVGGAVETKTYTAWGKDRTGSITKTDRQYTGQINESELGLYFYNARYYDSALGRFIQADTIVPIEAQGVQAWDRFAYSNNNPILYNDPSGHSVDCGLGDPYCNVGEYSPDGLINIYSQAYGRQTFRTSYYEKNGLKQSLSQEIESYLLDHSTYNVKDDILTGNNYAIYSNVREEYWRNRCLSPGSGCDLAYDIERLHRYYDNHENIQVRKFDSSLIDWGSVGFDTGSMVLSLVSLNAPAQSAKAIYTNFGSQLFGGTSAVYSFSSKDNIGGWLSVGGFAPPPLGTLASIASVIRDFSAGFYNSAYVPSIPR